MAPEPTDFSKMTKPFASNNTSAIQPKTGDAALEHLSRPDFSDIVLDVADAGIFYANRSYLSRSERFKAYSEWRFYNVLQYLYTQDILSDWFCAERLAETLSTTDYFLLDEIKADAIDWFPTVWKSAIASSYFAPTWISLEVVSELITTQDMVAANKLRFLGTWFARGDDLFPDPKVFDVVTSKISTDTTLTRASVQQLQTELGHAVFTGIVPSSFLADAINTGLKDLREKRLREVYDSLNTRYTCWNAEIVQS
ncbi:hypothetical protein HK102_008430 [Quaeritorhiza haematococci]|nr:hypothetical protein HK102_008430 [Quaeritorhiza haematococci]